MEPLQVSERTVTLKRVKYLLRTWKYTTGVLRETFISDLLLPSGRGQPRGRGFSLISIAHSEKNAMKNFRKEQR